LPFDSLIHSLGFYRQRAKVELKILWWCKSDISSFCIR